MLTNIEGCKVIAGGLFLTVWAGREPGRQRREKPAGGNREGGEVMD